MTDGDDEAIYTLKGMCEMLGVPRHVVLGFVAAGFIKPTRGPRNAYRFGFRDVVLVRTAQSLRAADIPTRRILRALRRLRQRLPATMPISGLRIVAIGDDVVVRDAGLPVAAESGQLLIDFSVSASGTVLSFPDAKRSSPEDEPAATAVAAAVGVEAHRARGAQLYERGDARGALAAYDAALAEAPDDAELHYNRAIVLEDLDRVDDAIAGYEACLVVDPAFADAHWNVARLYEQRGGAREALRHFNAFRRLQRR